MSHEYIVPVFIPVVSLWPIMGPLGVLPELCKMIEVWTAAISFYRIKKVISGLQWGTTCAIYLLPWGRQTELAAFEVDGRIYVNCRTIMPPHDGDSMVYVFRGFQTRWGRACRPYAIDDSAVEHLISDTEDESDSPVDHSMESLFTTCGLVAGCYDER